MFFKILYLPLVKAFFWWFLEIKDLMGVYGIRQSIYLSAVIPETQESFYVWIYQVKPGCLDRNWAARTSWFGDWIFDDWLPGAAKNRYIFQQKKCVQTKKTFSLDMFRVFLSGK